jgi:hypothetical protein
LDFPRGTRRGSYRITLAQAVRWRACWRGESDYSSAALGRSIIRGHDAHGRRHVLGLANEEWIGDLTCAGSGVRDGLTLFVAPAIDA